VFVIRQYKPKDLKQIMTLEANAFPKTSYNQKIFENWCVALPQYFLVYVDESTMTIVGYVLLWPTGHIASIAVFPEFRRKGIGSRLMGKAIELCPGGVARIEVRPSNEAAVAFYKALGFREAGVVPEYYEDEDAIVMVKLDK